MRARSSASMSPSYFSEMSRAALSSARIVSLKLIELLLSGFDEAIRERGQQFESGLDGRGTHGVLDLGPRGLLGLARLVTVGLAFVTCSEGGQHRAERVVRRA